jgi:hypothetical protein
MYSGVDKFENFEAVLFPEFMTDVRRGLADEGAGFFSTTSSSKLFHAPHLGHFPSHLGLSYSHSEHIYTVFSAFITIPFLDIS